MCFGRSATGRLRPHARTHVVESRSSVQHVLGRLGLSRRHALNHRLHRLGSTDDQRMLGCQPSKEPKVRQSEYRNTKKLNTETLLERARAREVMTRQRSCTEADRPATLGTSHIHQHKFANYPMHSRNASVAIGRSAIKCTGCARPCCVLRWWRVIVRHKVCPPGASLESRHLWFAPADCLLAWWCLG